MRKIIIWIVAVAICMGMSSNAQKVSAMDNDQVEKQVNSSQESQTGTLEPTPENAFLVYHNDELGNYIYQYDVSKGGTDVVIPDTIGGKKIQTISDDVFKNKGITSVYIPDGITKIANNAFSGNKISELILPDTLKTLGSNVFNGNKQLETLILPDSLETMGNSAFANCGIKELKLPNNIKTIPASAFYSNKLVEVVIPDSVETIAAKAFQANLAMQKVHLSENLLTIESFAFQDGKIQELYIGEKVQTIKDNAFADNHIEAITLPETLTTIGDYAFEANDLTSLKIPDSVTALGSHAFTQNSIKSLEIGKGITTISNTCFRSNLLQEITIPKNVNQIDELAFDNNLLLSVDLPDTVTTLAAHAFGTQKISTGLTKMNGSNVKRMSQLYDATQLEQIRSDSNSVTWGAYNATTKEVTLTQDISKNRTIFNYYYHIENNSVISSDTALNIQLLFDATYDYQVVFKDSDNSVLKTEYVKHGESATAPNDPTPPENMSFSKWDKGYTGVTGELTVKAVYEMKKYDVNFKNTDETLISSAKVEHDTLATKPADPVQVGYTFGGWFEDKNHATPWNFETKKILADTTIYAKWTIKQYTATFDGNGGSDGTDITVDYDSALGALPTSSRPGYTFVGWYTKATGGDKIDKNTKMPASETMYYAHWTIKQYTATFDGNGGSAGTSITADYDTALGTLPTSLRPGYTFDGWFTDRVNGTKIDENNLMPKDGITYYAQWTINQYTATFDGNGGTNGANITVNYDAKLGSLPDSQRDGYIFTGWFTDKENGTKIDENTKMPANGATYYARWSGVTSTVTLMDEEEVIKEVKVQYNTKYGGLPTLTKNGYIFIGWYSQLDGQGSVILDTTIVQEKKDHTIYAYWKQINFNHSTGSVVVDEGEDVHYDLKIEDQGINNFNQDSNLLSVYDIYFTMNDQRIDIGNKKITVSLYLKEAEKYFDHYQVVYLDANGQMVETYIPRVELDYSVLTFEVSHLSYYGIVAWDDPEGSIQKDNNQIVNNEKNRDKILTNDTNNIGLYVALGSISLLLMAGLLHIKSIKWDSSDN